MNIKPVIAQKSPYPIEVEEGKSYYWCQCGQSKKHLNNIYIQTKTSPQAKNVSCILGNVRFI